MVWRDHYPLRDVSALQTGGVSEYYAQCDTLSEVMGAIERAESLKLPYRVLGDGTGVLMSDAGYPGVIIQNKAASLLFMHDRSQVIVDSGMPVAQLVSRTLSQGFSGLEFLSGSSGTIGAALYGNTSRYGHQIGDYVKSATLFLPSRMRHTDALRRVDREWLTFGYRTSKLKQMQAKDPLGTIPVILSITLQLSKMSPASCIQKVGFYHQQQKAVPEGIPCLEVFDSLRFSHERTAEAVTHRGFVPPVHFIDKVQIKQCHSGAITIFSHNPNFICNTAMGVSRDAWQVVEQIQSVVDQTHSPLEVYCERVGLWES